MKAILISLKLKLNTVSRDFSYVDEEFYFEKRELREKEVQNGWNKNIEGKMNIITLFIKDKYTFQYYL